MYFTRAQQQDKFAGKNSQQSQSLEAALRRAGRSLRAWLAGACGSALLLCVFSGGAEAANNPVPYIQILSPVSVHPGATSVTLTVLGAGFVGPSVVKWNGTALTTTFVSATKLTAAVPDNFVAAVGLGSITVVNPPSRTSNVVYFPVAAAESATTFPATPSSSVSVGRGPTGIVTADFNGDGKLDLAVANSTDGTVSILLGNGDGTFTLMSTPTAGSGANWLAVGDFNEDGKLDLAVANTGSGGTGGVTILLGNGDGTFTTGASLTTGSKPFAIVTADFNRDGHLDLAVSNSGSGTVSVFTGSGTGTFALASTPTVGVMPQVIVTGDFNEDGKLDLAVSNELDNTVSILLGNGNGTFQTQSAVSSGGSSGFPIGLIAADFNGDGHLDLAAVNASDVGILLGNGSGGFTLGSDPMTGSGDLISGVAGDYNGDGKLDIVVSDQDAGEAFLLLGNGDGTFGSAVTFTTAAGAYGVATADFNGDGALDLAISNQGAANASIFLQQLPVSLAPTSLAFGNQGVGSTSSPAKTVTLTNHSGSSLNISSITFTGADGSDFARPGGTCSTSMAVANNATCTMTVTFTPAAIGARTGTLTITDGAGNSPQTLGLTGTGTVSAPTISKAFGASTIALEGTTSLSFTITNPGSNSISLTGVAFSDTFPAGLLINTPNGLTGSCGGGTITATAGVGSLSLTGATIAASGSCTFSVNVVGITAGAQANTTGTVSSNESGAGATSNTATVTVIGPPVITKAFGAASVPLNGATSLSFTIQNNNTTQSVSGIGFTDTLPSGLVIATPNGLTGSCGGGTITATAGSGSVSLSGSTLAASGSCSFAVNVRGTSAGAENNTTGAVTSANGGTGGTASASLAVVAPPTIAKAFGAAAIALNGTTSLNFTVTNPAANTVAETGVAFSDTLPTGLAVATPNGLSSTCGGTATAVAGSTSVSLTAGSIATPNTSCTVQVNVTGTAAGNYTNTTGSVSSTNGGTGNTATANLTVASPPSITKAFGAATIPLNGATSLTLSITNPNSGVTLTGMAFTDSLPAGLVVATPNNLSSTCGGTATGVAGAGSVSLAGGTLVASASCTVSLNVQGTTVGVKNNSVQVTSTEGGTGNTSNASITVVSPPVITKAFGAASVALNGTTSLSLTIQNNNATQSLTGIGFTDTMPAGLAIATPNGLTGSCGGGTITAAGSGSVSLSGATLVASSSCNFSVNVTGSTAGAKSNTTGAVTSTNGGTGGAASASLAVVAPPSISKAFGAASIPPSGTTSLSFTITNPAANTVSLTGVAFTDTLPANIVVATPNGLTGSCGGGTITAVAGAGSASLSGAVLTTNSSCTFAVNVTGTVNGNYTNTTGAVISTNGGTGNTASANLAISLPPAITSANSTTFAVGTAGSFTVTTTGSPVPALTKTGSLPSGVTFTDNGNGTATLSGTPAGGTGGIYPITVTAANGVGTNATQTFTLTVNQAAAFASASGATFTVGTAGSFTFTTTGTPAAALTKTGALPSGVTFTDNGNGTATLSGTPAGGTGGTYPITVTAANGVGTNATQTFTLTVNQAAAIASASGATFTVGTAGSFTFTTTGTPASALTKTGALPSGVTFTDNGNGTATLSGTPAAGTGGTYTITITANNGVPPNGTQSFTLTVNQAAAFASASGATFTVGTAGSFTFTTTGTPAAALTKTGALPSGVTFTDNGNGTATLSGTPAGGTGGTYPITVTAANGVGTNATQTFTLTVNQAAAIMSANNATFTVGAAGSFTVTTTGSPTATLSKTGSLPSGVTFTDNGNGTATLSGTPVAGSGGTYTITITANNGVPPNGTQSYTLTVDQAPAVTSASNVSFVFGVAGTFTITVPGFPFPSISTASPLPNGVTLVDNHNGTATLSGTPLAGSAGSYPVTITASNGVLPNATQSFTLTVSQVMPVVTWAAPAAITFGTALGAGQLNATANVAGTFVYTPAAGAVPGAGVQSLSVNFTPTDTTDYTNASGNVMLTVNKATPAITWATPAAISFGTALSGTQLDATSSVAGTFVYTPASGATLSAGAQNLSTSFSPTDLTDYNTATANVTLTVNKATPAITWPAPAAITYGAALGNGQLDATANTPGTFVYAQPAGTVLAAGLQTLSVNFTPNDTADYGNASANNSLTVNKAILTVTANNATSVFGQTPGGFTASYSGFVNGDTAGVLTGTPSVTTAATASSPAGMYAITPTAGTLAAANYAFSFVNGTLTIGKATPVITWVTPAAITFGAALGAAQLDATANVAGNFAYTPAAGTILGAGSQSLSASFTPADATDYSTAAGGVTLTVNKATPAITWSAPAPITFGTALSNAQLDATASTAGSFAYLPAAGAVLDAGAQTLNTTFTPADAVDYLGAVASVTLVVHQATTSTALVSSASSAVPGANVTFTATVSSNAGTATGSVTFLDETTQLGGATLNRGTAVFATSSLSLGVHAITAVYSGSTDFSGSTSAVVIESIGNPGFTVAPTTGAYTASVVRGQSVLIPLTVTPLGGFTGVVSFSASGLPLNTSDFFSPPSINLGSSPAVVRMVLVTSPGTGIVAQKPAPTPQLMAAAILWLPLAGLVFAVAGPKERLRRRASSLVVLLLLLGTAAGFAGCASGSSQRVRNIGTPAGTYTITVTGTSGSTQQAIAVITLQVD